MAYDPTAAIQATRRRIRNQIRIIHDLRSEGLETALAYRVLHHLFYSLRVLRWTRSKCLLEQALVRQHLQEAPHVAGCSQAVELKGIGFLVLRASAQTQDHSEQRKSASNDTNGREQKRTRP